jgi:hypothetical protein
LTGDAQNIAVYNKDLAGFILVDVVYASLRTSGTYTDTFTLSLPKGNLIPNFEGYETNDGFGRTRTTKQYSIFPLQKTYSVLLIPLHLTNTLVLVL